MNEDRYSSSAYFITLTYDRNHVPITKNGFMGLCDHEFRDYMYRLRISQTRYYAKAAGRYNQVGRLLPGKIKYYAVGEYGGKSGRPHYHAIIFNSELNLLADAWRCYKPGCNCGKMLGDIHYGQVSGASVGYVLKYLSKSWKPKHSNDDRYPQFARMSQKLGINYLTPSVIAWHKGDLENNVYCTTRSGVKLSMPRYYKDKIYNSEERGYLKGHFERLAMSKDAEQFRKSEGVHSPNYSADIGRSFTRIYSSSIQTETI